MEQNKQQAPAVKRKIIFIKKGLQLRYMFLLVGCVLFGMLVMAYEFMSYLDIILEQSPSLFQPFYDKLIPMAVGISMKVLVYLAFIVIIASIISHRIAGPIYRFEQTCKEVAAGNFSKRVHLREKDSFVELQDDFNAMMDAVEKEIKDCKESKK